MKRVSFDFDFTLSEYKVMQFAKWCKVTNCDLWIVTSRVSDKNLRKHELPKNWNSDLWEVVDEILDMEREKVVFTEFTSKHEFFWSDENQDFLFHLDDDKEEIRLLKAHCPNLVAMNHLEDPKWAQKLTKLVKDETS